MIVNVRLVLTGGLTVLAGCNWAPHQGWVIVTAVGALILTVALYHDVMRLAAQPLLVRVRTHSPVSAPQRGGLGAQRRSEPGEYWPFDGPDK